SAQTVKGMFALPHEATDDVPRAAKRIERASSEENAALVLGQRAGGHRGVGVVDESTRAAFDETVAVRKLTPAARARRPSVEQSHEENHARSTRADRRRARAGARAAGGRGSDARRRSGGS